MPGASPTEADREIAARVMFLPAEGLEKMRRACFSTAWSAEGAVSCQMLAMLHSEGISGMKLDKAESDRLYDRGNQHYLQACDAGDFTSCASLGGMWSIKLRSLAPESDQAREWARAVVPLLEKACRAGIRRSCGGLSDIYEMGRGVGRDAIKATAYRAQEDPAP